MEVREVRENLTHLRQRRRTPSTVFSFAIPDEQMNLLYQISGDYGVSLSQIGREALLLWLSHKNLIPPTDLPKHLQPHNSTRQLEAELILTNTNPTQQLELELELELP